MADVAVPLPAIDEHAIVIDAGVRESWAALLDHLARTTSGPATALYARAVGADPSGAAGPRPLAEGSTIPGFRVTSAGDRRELLLRGQHRFSTYELIFRLQPRGERSTELRAESRAAFPGWGGRLYRALIIPTGLHITAVRRMLESIRQRATSGMPSTDAAVGRR